MNIDAIKNWFGEKIKNPTMRKIIYAAAFAICSYLIYPNNTGKITQEPTFWNNNTIYFNYEQKNDQNNTEIYQIVMKKENGKYIIRVKKQEKAKDGKTIWRTQKYDNNETFSVESNDNITPEITEKIQQKVKYFKETEILEKCETLLQEKTYQEFINTITENKENIKGIDISHYNKIDNDKFKKRIKENNIRYIYIKATEGDDEKKNINLYKTNRTNKTNNKRLSVCIRSIFSLSSSKI